MTAQEICTAALTLTGRLGAGRTPGPVESAVAFGILKRLMESLGLERTYIYQVASAVYPLAALQLSGTLGPGGTLAPVRPVFIERANVVLTIGTDTLREPLTIATADQWASIKTQGDASVLPRALYNDYAFPASTVSLNPVPKTTMQLELYTWQQLQTFAALTDTFSAPPGYDRFLKDALAIEIAPTFQKPITKELLNAYQASKAAIIARNLGLPAMPESSPAAAAPPQPAMPPAA